MPAAKNIIRIAAIGDIHHSRTAAPGLLQPLFSQINEAADILVLCGDLTDYGLADEARALLRELSVVKIPTIAVLGNHDFESSQQDEIRTVLAHGGVAVLVGDRQPSCAKHGLASPAEVRAWLVEAAQA